MTYYILYDKATYTITKISPTLEGVNNPNSWVQIYVDLAHQTYFESNYSNVKYDAKNQALVYPDDYQTDELLSNNNNSLYNSLSNEYQNALNTFSNTANSLTAALNSASNAINVSNSASWVNIQSQINSVVELTQIKDNYNYLTSDEQNSFIDYFFSNTPLNLNDIFKDLPSQDNKVTLAFTVNSSLWQYIYPQIQQNDPQAEIDGTNIYVRGNNVNELLQKLNTLLDTSNNKSLWAIIHYGKDITVSNVGIYYGKYPSQNDASSNMSSINNSINTLNSEVSSLSTATATYATAAMVNSTNTSVSNNANSIAVISSTVNSIVSHNGSSADLSSYETISEANTKNQQVIDSVNSKIDGIMKLVQPAIDTYEQSLAASAAKSTADSIAASIAASAAAINAYVYNPNKGFALIGGFAISAADSSVKDDYTSNTSVVVSGLDLSKNQQVTINFSPAMHTFGNTMYENGGTQPNTVTFTTQQLSNNGSVSWYTSGSCVIKGQGNDKLAFYDINGGASTMVSEGSGTYTMNTYAVIASIQVQNL